MCLHHLRIFYLISTSPNACSTLSNISVSKYKSDNDATKSAVPLTAVPKPIVTPTANCPGIDSLIICLALSPAACLFYKLHHTPLPKKL